MRSPSAIGVAALLGAAWVASCSTGNAPTGSRSSSLAYFGDGGGGVDAGAGADGGGDPDPCANVTCPGTQECENGHCYDALPNGSSACRVNNASVGDDCCTAADCCGQAGAALACDATTYTCQHPPATDVSITCGASSYTCPVYWSSGTGGASVWIGGACSQEAAGELGGSDCPAGGGAYCVFDCAGCCVARGASCQPGDAGSTNPCCEGSSCVNGVCTQCPLAGEYCGDGQGCCPGLGLECDGNENNPTYDTCITVQH
jgi:hypothetical protein